MTRDCKLDQRLMLADKIQATIRWIEASKPASQSLYFMVRRSAGLGPGHVDSGITLQDLKELERTLRDDPIKFDRNPTQGS